MEAVNVPHINPNENRATVVAVFAVEGDRVSEGDVLFELETTKTAVEVVAPVDGYVIGLNVSAGDSARVGELLTWIGETQDAVPPKVDPPERSETESRITVRARALADELGVDWREISSDGIISTRLVREAASAMGVGRVSLPAGSPVKNAKIPVLIMGAGGHGKTVAEMLRSSTLAYVRGFIDPNKPAGTESHGLTVIGSDADVKNIIGDIPHIGAVACGLLDPTARLRIAVFERCVNNGLLLPPIVHPTAFVDPSAILGAGVQVHAGARVGADAVLADGCVINTNAVVSHDCHIGEHTHIAPGALLAGGVNIGARCLIGMGVTVFAGVSIDAEITVNNGQDVFSSLDANRN